MPPVDLKQLIADYLRAYPDAYTTDDGLAELNEFISPYIPPYETSIVMTEEQQGLVKLIVIIKGRSVI
jgi:hypothetical protein